MALYHADVASLCRASGVNFPHWLSDRGVSRKTIFGKTVAEHCFSRPRPL